MQEQLSTARLFTGAIPFTGDGDAYAPAETEPRIVERRPPLAQQVLQSVGRAFLTICLSGPSTNCGQCNARWTGTPTSKATSSLRQSAATAATAASLGTNTCPSTRMRRPAKTTTHK